ncbi:hypothetical protein LUZ60_015613 [Juncus effusus]|nr:hypothetical protein LUZ60_015613 [Juncus effusus]
MYTVFISLTPKTKKRLRMGQALRRVSGRVRPSAVAPSPAPAKPPSQTPPATGRTAAAPQDRVGVSDSDVASSSKDEHDTALDERDQNYDKMLTHMVGRIKAKPGGKLEMGEASIVERYDRPLPKLRTTNAESPGGIQQRPLPAGTLKIEQIHQIMLFYQGKSDGQDSKLVQEISERFNVDVSVVKNIVKSVSLPKEQIGSNEKSEER